MEEDNKFSYFFLGLGLGVAAGLLFAPKSGEETRRLIGSKADEGREYLKQRTTDLKDTANEAMDQTTLLYVMTAFVIISAIALCIQAGMLAAMYKTTKAMQQSVQPLLPKVESLVDSAKTTIDQSKTQIAEITSRANEILDSTK